MAEHKKLWALVEHDKEVGSILGDMRKNITLAAAANCFGHAPFSPGRPLRLPRKAGSKNGIMSRSFSRDTKHNSQKDLVAAMSEASSPEEGTEPRRSKSGFMFSGAGHRTGGRRKDYGRSATRRQRANLSRDYQSAVDHEVMDVMCNSTPRCVQRLAQQGVCRALCRPLCGPVLHPDGRFRVTWNVMLCIFIVYCGIAVPLEICFETDMVQAMCGVGDEALRRAECPSFLSWFWINILIDLWFIADIVVNCRTGYVLEGHFVDDGYLAMKHYLKGSFMIDVIGSFPIQVGRRAMAEEALALSLSLSLSLS